MQFCARHTSGQAKITYPVRLVGVEQVLRTHGAGRQVAAFMAIKLGQVHAGVAAHAVAGVHTQPLAQATQVAEGAVVDGPLLLIIPQATDAAVVPRHCHAAACTLRCSPQSSHAQSGCRDSERDALCICAVDTVDKQCTANQVAESKISVLLDRLDDSP